MQINWNYYTKWLDFFAQTFSNWYSDKIYLCKLPYTSAIYTQDYYTEWLGSRKKYTIWSDF